VPNIDRNQVRFFSSSQPLLNIVKHAESISRFSLKNQWKRPLQACTAHLHIRWRIKILLSALNYRIPISSSFIQRQNGRTRGPIQEIFDVSSEKYKRKGVLWADRW